MRLFLSPSRFLVSPTRAPSNSLSSSGAVSCSACTASCSASSDRRTAGTNSGCLRSKCTQQWNKHLYTEKSNAHSWRGGFEDETPCVGDSVGSLGRCKVSRVIFIHIASAGVTAGQGKGKRKSMRLADQIQTNSTLMYSIYTYNSSHHSINRRFYSELQLDIHGFPT